MTAVFGVPVDAAYHLVYALTTFLTPVLGGLAAVAGIVVFTMAIRLLVMPLSFRALRGQAAQARLAPQIQALRKRYGRQPERLQRELTALYRREGTSLFAGIAPLLAQWPVFSVLYLLFRSPAVAGGPNRLLSRDLFGVPLGGHWLSGAGVLSAQGAVFLGLLAILAVICWLSVRVARRVSGVITARGAAATEGVPGFIVTVLPYLTVVIAAFAPLAAAVYLVVSTGWSVAERWAFASRQPGSGAQGRSGAQGGSGAQGTGARPGASPTLRDRAHRP
ncbi:MAG TPA: membrane protein insertase YidC [Trebonia sp.]|nr:membrane protein insertase YidC [Trebonia sp.]